MKKISPQKEIALYFIEKTQIKVTPAFMKKTVAQVNKLLESGYTQEEIEMTIDYIVDIEKMDMYSIGLVNYKINKVIAEVGLRKKPKRKVDRTYTIEQEVKHDERTAERNRQKAEGFGDKSRFGEKFNFDLLKE